ncbi:PIN domain-containing protein [Thiohalocapsa sp. ML1]|jgi:predicted nucleic acid-binding protein|uniref:type II toxin-antitoxin system VapC family toxin n=1 Tax=Thiohalocapsa sp. ML1 TaxID=1431688 RepID=UPI000731F832|nr:PIN domain-containing protein [Thiohalocapsa sp. ML1]
MTEVLTYIDANVLIAAFHADNAISAAAMAVLRAPARRLLVGDALWLETVPKARFHRRDAEVAFYEGVFALAHEHISWSPAIIERARELASRYGLAAMDAVHVASALVGGADELVTGERWDKPMLRVRELSVQSIRLRG